MKAVLLTAGLLVTLTAIVSRAQAPAVPAAPASPDPQTLPAAASDPIDFARDVVPILDTSCIRCHGRGKARGGFSLETRAMMMEGGDSGDAVLPGKSGDSLLIHLVAGLDPDNVMPQKGSRLRPAQIGVLRAWIDQGAPWPADINFAKIPPRNLHRTKLELPPLPSGALMASHQKGSGRAASAHPVDRLLAPYFEKHGITPGAPASDRRFVRRVYLDVIGLLPSPEQVTAFVKDRRPDKRAKLVDALLANRRQYAEHWLSFWNDALRNDYRGTGYIDGGRRQITMWLYAALASNLPYDQFVAQLVNAAPGAEGFTKGIVWRGVVNASQTPPMQAAQNISQVFMGVNLKCASCHDSFINDWQLADAYGLASIYATEPLEMVECDRPTGKMSPTRFLYSELGKIDPKAPRHERLAQLASVMTGPENGRLSRTIVNRLWARFMGRGLVEPLDDMDRPAWSPEIMDFLAEDLVAHGYDLKRTIEVILTSRAYQLPSVEGPKDDKEKFIFQGPLTRRLTAEQFADGIAALTGDWPRMPSSIDVDFTVGGVAPKVKLPKWIWSPEANELGEARRLEVVARRAAAPPPPATRDKRPDGNPADLLKHKIVFRKVIELADTPPDAQAVLLASQGAFLTINGARPKTTVADQSRGNRIALMDITSLLKPGRNVIVIEATSHTDKGALNDEEKRLYPNSMNHLNRTPGVAFYARLMDCCGGSEIVTDDTWSARREPRAGWAAATYDDTDWPFARPLPDGVAPVDEGPTLEPIRRKDYANENIHLGPRLRAAVATASFPGKARASLRPADPLAVALDRPNREQVATSRLTAATTLQALELTNGDTLDAKLNFAGKKLVEKAAQDPRTWLDRTYTHLLARPPTDAERTTALSFLGEKPTPENLSDLLWSLAMLPEFQLIN